MIEVVAGVLRAITDSLIGKAVEGIEVPIMIDLSVVQDIIKALPVATKIVVDVAAREVVRGAIGDA